MADEAMPSSRATARNESPAAPTVASWPRARSVISAVSFARARSRAVIRGTSRSLPPGEHCTQARAMLLTPTAGGAHALDCFESTALTLVRGGRDGATRGGGQGPGG